MDVDEDARTLVMHRGAVSVVVNVGAAPATVDLSGEHEVLFATPAGASLVADGIELPPHAGALAASYALNPHTPVGVPGWPRGGRGR